MNMVFSNRNHPAQLRYGAWCDALKAQYMLADVTEVTSAASRDTFAECAASIKKASFGHVTLSEGFGPAQRVERNTSHVTRLAKDCCYIGIALHGELEVRQAGASFGVVPGRAALFSANAPLLLQCARVVRMLFVEFPSAEFQRRLGRPLCALTASIDTQYGIGRIAENACRNLGIESSLMSKSLRAPLGDHLLDLLALAFTPSRQDASESMMEKSVQSARMHDVRAYIEANLGDPMLSPESIALANRMSIRALHYLFKAADVSVTDHIWSRRLERCRGDLEMPSNRSRSISAIAFAAGFNSLSHFSSAFRRRFGMTPSEARGLSSPEE